MKSMRLSWRKIKLTDVGIRYASYDGRSMIIAAMRKLRFIFVISIALGSMAPAVRAQSQIIDGVVISGVVSDVATGMPLQNARVTLLPSPRSILSDQDGRFAFSDVPPGRYRIVPELSGYVYARPAHLQYVREPGVWVTVSEEDKDQQIEVSMEPEGTISGLVLDQSGQPIVNVSVALAQYSYDRHGRKNLSWIPGLTYGQAGSFVRTDDQGQYRFYGLQRGEYYLRVYGVPFGITPGYVIPTVYYPGGTEETARPIYVAPAAELRLPPIVRNSSMAVQVQFRISGEIPPDGIVDTGLRLGGALLGGLQSENRRIVAPAVAPGRYEGLFYWRTSRTDILFSQFILDVGNADVDQEITVSRGAKITGSIVHESADGRRSSIPGVRCRLYADVVSISTTGTGSLGCIGGMASQGFFRLELEGLPADSFVVSATANGIDVLTGDVHISGDTDLEIIVTDLGGRFTGTVRTMAGEVVPEAVVLLRPSDSNYKLRYRTVIGDINGKFEISGIAPGTYDVFAWPEIQGEAYHSSEFMEPYNERAQRIDIGRGSHVVADVQTF